MIILSLNKNSDEIIYCYYRDLLILTFVNEPYNTREGITRSANQILQN